MQPLSSSSLQDSLDLRELWATHEPKKESRCSVLEPWVWFSLGACFFLAASDYIVSMFRDMGPRMMMYYSVGPLIGCMFYFPGQWLGYIQKHQRSLLRRETGELDVGSIFYIFANVLVQAAIIILLNINFRLSILANLNIGIAQTVHASQAFFVAFLDYLIFGKVLSLSLVIGMLTIMICVILIVFSNDQN